MKRVLFIAYHFPPLAGGGTFRSLKFVKYLPEFGWLPTVLTTNTKNYWAYDDSLLDEVPKEVKIIRAAEFDPLYLHILLSKIGLGKLYQKIKDRFLIPDEKIGWIPFAYWKAVKELRKQKYDLIFSTSPTPCAHIIAYKLKKHFKIPWVADYRDLWTLNPECKYSFSKRLDIENRIENIINNQADKIIAVTKGNVNDLQTSFKLPQNNVRLIYNGFDPLNTNHNKTINDKRFSITYTGTFYGDRNPKVVLDALAVIIKNNPEISRYIHFQFIGKSDFDILNETNHLGISDNVTYTPTMKRSEINKIYQISNILLLIIPKNQQHILTSKIFDYLSTQKPVLAIIPEGEAKDILKNSNLGFFADPDTPKDIKNQIMNLYDLWKTGTLQVRPNLEFIQQFHRRNLTKQLAKIFEATI